MITIHNHVNVFENKLRPNGTKTSEVVAEIDSTLCGLKNE
jgi:hypothetical protein